jgi:TRAP-type mannitol/chloroaromatic compound transport system substrate-binding protein
MTTKLGFYKVAPHYPGWWEGGPMLLFVNLEKWNALPKSIRAFEQAGHLPTTG